MTSNILECMDCSCVAFHIKINFLLEKFGTKEEKCPKIPLAEDDP